MSAIVVHGCRPAMGTLFETWLVGDDGEHLTAVSDAVLDEVVRLEHLLSRFDPRSEISRINRQAHEQPVLVDVELFDILQTCRRYWRQMDGYYDVAATRTIDDLSSPRPSFAGVVLDEERRSVRLTDRRLKIDLGGFGKGYALDAAAEILTRFGVSRALLHGGTSSVLARGSDEHGQAWPVGIRDPSATADDARELCTLRLRDQGYSCSATFAPGQPVSDIVDPRAGTPLVEQAACVVVAATSLEAEILSTALLSMGKSRAAAYTEEHADERLAVAWIDEAEGRPEVNWLCGSASLNIVDPRP
jgi:FAD:protein FMN transferase